MISIDANFLRDIFSSTLKGKEVIVYLALASQGNTPIVSYNDIASITGFSKKTVIEKIKTLESKGLLIKLKWLLYKGENDKNCYILFRPNDPFNRDKIDKAKAEYIARALEQLRNNRDGQPLIEPWLEEVVKITLLGVDITPPKNDDDEDDDDNQDSNIKPLGGDSVNSTPQGGEIVTHPNVNVDDESKRSGCLQRYMGGVKKETPEGKINVVVDNTPFAKKAIRYSSQKKETTPWVRFLSPGEEANQNEITVNLKEFFQVDLYMAVANATAERVYLALEAVLQYAKRTAIRNLQGILVKAVTCGWKTGTKVFIANKSKKQEIITIKKKSTQTEQKKEYDKYRELYRLVSAMC